MKHHFTLCAAVTLLTGIGFGQDTDLNSIKAKYEAERSRGITTLNQKYIESYKTELANLLKAQKLDEANKVQEKIKKLEDEIAAFSSASKSTSPTESEPKAGFELTGKTAHYPSDRKPDQPVKMIFHKDHAVFIGLSKVAVYWLVEPGKQEGEYHVRDHRQPRTIPWKILVHPDGDSARITNPVGSFSVKAKLVASTPEEISTEPKIRPTP